jgi:hypothetical protein
LGVAVREIVYKAIKGLHDRANGLRYRGRAQSRSWRAHEAIAIVLVLGLILGLGALLAMAVTRGDSATLYTAQSNTGLPSSVRPEAGTEVITETVKRGEATVRVVRRRLAPGTVLRTFAGASPETVYRAQTVTKREIATVTDLRQVTVTAAPETITVIETVTCKPKDCK